MSDLRRRMSDVEMFVQFKVDQMREQLDRLAYQYVVAIHQDTRKYVEQLVKEYETDLRSPTKP